MCFLRLVMACECACQRYRCSLIKCVLTQELALRYGFPISTSVMFPEIRTDNFLSGTNVSVFCSSDIFEYWKDMKLLLNARNLMVRTKRP